MLTVDPYVPLKFRSEGRPFGKPITLVPSDQMINIVEQVPSDLFDPTPGLPVVNAAAVIGDVIDQTPS
jgi:hypothetical protein